VLDGVMDYDAFFDGDMQAALRDYVARNAIRKVHLRDNVWGILADIISTLTPEDDGIRDNSVESIVLVDMTPFYLDPQHQPLSDCADVSKFFSQHRFPSLRDLSLSGRFAISSSAWDSLKSHATALTNLSLLLIPPSPTLTTSRILSLLASNPNIRNIKLTLSETDDDSESGSKSRIPLRHLKNLTLGGEPYRVFPILHRLELPERADMRLEFHDRTPDEVKDVIAPHIQDYLLRDPRFEDRLGISIEASHSCILLEASVIGVGYHGPDRLPRQGLSHTFYMPLWTPDESEKLCIDILALLPQERVVYFETDLPMTVIKEIVVAMPNLEALCLFNTDVYDGFLLPNPDGPNAHMKLLPSLQRLRLRNAEVHYFDWSPLVRYVTHQTTGNHSFSFLLIGDHTHICLEVAKEIEGLVEEFSYNHDRRSTFCKCSQM
jgi:hypothetical protein